MWACHPEALDRTGIFNGSRLLVWAVPAAAATLRAQGAMEETAASEVAAAAADRAGLQGVSADAAGMVWL